MKGTIRKEFLFEKIARCESLEQLEMTHSLICKYVPAVERGDCINFINKKHEELINGEMITD